MTCINCLWDLDMYCTLIYDLSIHHLSVGTYPSLHSFHYSFTIVTFLIACLFLNDRVLVKKVYCIKKLVSLLLGNQDTSILLMMDFCILTPVQVLTGCVCVFVCCICLFIVACTYRKVILLVSYQ